MSACRVIGKARFDCSVKVENFLYIFFILTYAYMSRQYKNAIILYQFCRLLFYTCIFEVNPH